MHFNSYLSNYSYTIKTLLHVKFQLIQISINLCIYIRGLSLIYHTNTRDRAGNCTKSENSAKPSGAGKFLAI